MIAGFVIYRLVFNISTKFFKFSDIQKIHFSNTLKIIFGSLSVTGILFSTQIALSNTSIFLIAFLVSVILALQRRIVVTVNKTIWNLTKPYQLKEMKNMIGYAMLRLTKAYQVNDLIESNGFFGKVISIDKCYTILQSVGNRKTKINNNHIFFKGYNNCSTKRREYTFSFLISDIENIDRIKSTLKNIILADVQIQTQFGYKITDDLKSKQVSLQTFCHPDHYSQLNFSLQQKVNASIEKPTAKKSKKIISITQSKLHAFTSNVN